MTEPLQQNKLGGIRLTSQRKTILETVQKMHSHPTADEVYLEVRASLPRVSLGTVYRNLESLCEAGYIKKVEHAGGAKRFDGNLDRHLHVRCTLCGLIQDSHEMPELAELVSTRIETDFIITGHNLEVQGICPRCRESAPV